MNNLIEKITSLAGRAQFISLTYKTKEKTNKNNVIVDGGEVSRFTCILGASYHNLVEKSLLAAQLMTLESLIDLSDTIDIETMKAARRAVILSLEKTIEAHKNGEQSADYTKKNLYIPLGNGINLNQNDHTLQLFVLIQSKKILKNGIHKQVNSAPETIAKNLITISLVSKVKIPLIALRLIIFSR